MKGTRLRHRRPSHFPVPSFTRWPKREYEKLTDKRRTKESAHRGNCELIGGALLASEKHPNPTGAAEL